MFTVNIISSSFQSSNVFGLDSNRFLSSALLIRSIDEELIRDSILLYEGSKVLPRKTPIILFLNDSQLSIVMGKFACKLSQDSAILNDLLGSG